MFPLLRRIALSVVLALVLAGLLMTAVVRALEDTKEAGMAGHLSGFGLRFVAREVARAPRERRAARVAEIERDFALPLRLAPTSRRVEGPDPLMRPWSEPTDDGPSSVAFLVDDGQMLLIGPPRGSSRRPRGPSPPFFGLPQGPPRGIVTLPDFEAPRRRATWARGPAPARFEEPLSAPQQRPRGTVLPLLGFLVCATLLTSLLVAIPLTRRFRVIERALNELSHGNFAARAGGPRGDALGPIAAALDRSAERLKRLFAERQELLQAVSHEIGTPLSRMRFHLEILERLSDTPAHRERVRALDEEIRELDDLSSELVHWVEADAARLAVRRIELRPLLDDVVELESSTLPREVSVGVEVDPGLTVTAEPRQFARCVENILRNALRYARDRVVIVARRGEGRVEVLVRDDGPGIPPEDRARVLQPFVRLDQSRSRAQGGTGLGLAIARRIAERHGGGVEIREAPGGGAEVCTWWPDDPPRLSVLPPEAR